MSLTLIVTRHAKSSWAAPDLDDHARPLNPRGRQSADAIGAWLAARGCVPDLVLSSDARRTRETWQGMAPHLSPAPEVRLEPALYHAGPGTLLQALHGAGGAATVLLIGHNPGIGAFASAILAAPPEHPRFHDYPTAATLIAEFDAPSWAGLRPGTGTPRDFVVPRDLAG